MMWKQVVVLIFLLSICLGLIFSLNISTAQFLVRTPALPPRYQKNDYTVQNVIDDSREYHCYYKFRDLNGNCIGWKWKYNKEDLDNDIGQFGIPDSVIKDYWGTQSQLEEIYAGLFHIRNQAGNTTTFGVNHNAVVNAYFHYAKPIAALLDKTLEDKDPENIRIDRISQLLYFTQDIPYGVPANKYGNRYYYGFFPPPLCLINTWGDCDTKSVLFCAILSQFPEYKLVTLDFPGHAAVGIQGVPGAYDTHFEYLGEEYIVCEPVGPRHTPFGDSIYSTSRLDNVFPITIDPQVLAFNQEDSQFSEKIISTSVFKEKLEKALGFKDAYQYEQAEKLFFELGLEFADEYLPFYYLGEMYKEKKDERYKEFFKTAIGICKASGNKDFMMYVHCGDMLYDIDDYPGAIAQYNGAYKEKSDSNYVLFRLGKCYYLQEKYSWAIKYFLLAYDLKPDNVVINYYLAQTYIKTNKWDTALSYLEAAFTLDPQNREVCTLLLEFYTKKLSMEKCMFYSSHLLSLDKNNSAALLSQAQGNFFLEKYEEALNIFKSIDIAHDQDIKKVVFYYWEGLILLCLDKNPTESFMNAVAHAKEKIETKQVHPEDYLYYGLAAAEIEEEVNDAVSLLQTIMRNDRDNKYYYSLANARLIEQTKSPEVAINFYNDAIKQYKNTDEMMLLYLCYFYMEEIYNTRKLEILIQDDPE